MIDGRYGNQMPVYYVYILRTLDNMLYIGVTETLDQRIKTHNSGKGAEWIKAHPGKREIQIKKWSRAKKEALIAGDFVKLKNLSQPKGS
jgi:putative endonuclease